MRDVIFAHNGYVIINVTYFVTEIRDMLDEQLYISVVKIQFKFVPFVGTKFRKRSRLS